MTDIDLAELKALLPHILASLPAAIMVILGAILLQILIGRGLRLVARKTRLRDEDLGPIRKVFGWVLFAATVVVLLDIFGFNLGGLWGIFSTVLAMVAIGFVAVWSVLSNTLCTVLILLFRPFAIGDELEFAGEPVRGRVRDINFLYTTLDCGDGCVMQIPNNLFFQKVLKRRHSVESVPVADHLRKSEPAAA